MRVRVLQLLNHYPDDASCSGDEPLGKLCAFGYHDAIEIYTENLPKIFSSAGTNMTLWKLMDNITIEKINGTHTMQFVSGIFEDSLQKKEEKFWKLEEQFPYRFIVMMRIADISSLETQERLKKENVEENLIIYKTLEHCEIIAVCKTKTYKEGLEIVEDLRKKFKAQKTYSVFAIEEALLKKKKYWEARLKKTQEMVKILLNITMKNKGEALAFLDELERIIMKNNLNVTSKIYDILGDEDLLYEIDHVPLERVLPFYAMGEILSHSNEKYKKAFYNIETKFIIERGDSNGEK